MNFSRFSGLGRAARDHLPAVVADADVLVLTADDQDPAPALAPSSNDGADPAPEPAPEPAPAPEQKPEPEPEPQVDQAAFDAGAQAQIARHQAVFASEHYAGREGQANKLLANSKLGADEIVALLADQPRSGAVDMLAGMGGDNPPLGAGAAPDPNPQAAAQASWAKTFDKLGWKQPA